MNNLEQYSVLVVDDDNVMREVLKFILRSGDYLIAGEASNGPDAIQLCLQMQPHVVLLDINMPKMDGLQTLEELRKVGPETIVLIVSADSTMDKVREAIAKGAVGFVVKPLNAANILDKVAACLRSKVLLKSQVPSEVNFSGRTRYE